MSAVKIYGNLPKNYLVPWTKNSEFVLKSGVGIPIKYLDRYFIVTARHTVSYCTQLKITCHKNDIEITYPSNVINYIDNYDIAFVELHKKHIDSFTYYKEFDYDISKLNTYYTKKDNIHEKLNHNNVSFTKSMNPQYPTKIFLYGKFQNKDLYESNKVKGYSGAPVYENSKLIGMIVHWIDEKIGIIPIKIIIRFLHEKIIHTKIKGMCSLPILYDILNGLELSDGHTRPAKMNGIKVNNDYSIKYGRQKIGCNQLIMHVVYNETYMTFSEKGYLPDLSLNYWIPFDTFISINYYSNDNLLLNTIDIKNTSKFVLKKLTLRPINELCNFTEFSPCEYESLNGYIIGSPSLDFLYLYQEYINNKMFNILIKNNIIKCSNNIKKSYILLDAPKTENKIFNNKNKDFFFNIISINKQNIIKLEQLKKLNKLKNLKKTVICTNAYGTSYCFDIVKQ